MFSIDLAIKFGSNEIIIYRKGIGLVAKEPAFLAVEETNDKMKVRAIGKKAEKLFLSSGNNITVYQPIKNSEIIDEKMATILLSEILNDTIHDKFFLNKISALVAVPCALNIEQLNKLKKVLQSSGIGKISFVQNSVCARANLDNLDSHSYIMVVDIGKYLTDISVLNEYNFVFGRMYYIGGADMDESITTFIADNHNLTVSDMTSEAVKNEIASLYLRDMNTAEYIGIDDNDKFIRKTISASEVRVAIENVYNEIFERIKKVLGQLNKEIYKDVCNNGIMFVGGSSTIAGLYEYAKKKLELPIIIPDEPSDMVILGAGKLLGNNKEFLKINY